MPGTRKRGQHGFITTYDKKRLKPKPIAEEFEEWSTWQGFLRSFDIRDRMGEFGTVTKRTTFQQLIVRMANPNLSMVSRPGTISYKDNTIP